MFILKIAISQTYWGQNQITHLENKKKKKNRTKHTLGQFALIQLENYFYVVQTLAWC